MADLTALPYMYRDASNYKQHGTIWLTGLITDEQREALKASLEVGECFIPAQVGLQHLGEDSEWNFPAEDDHCFHELLVDEIEITPNNPRPDIATETVEEFVAKMTAIGADGWDAAKYGIEA